MLFSVLRSPNQLETVLTRSLLNSVNLTLESIVLLTGLLQCGTAYQLRLKMHQVLTILRHILTIGRVIQTLFICMTHKYIAFVSQMILTNNYTSLVF